MNLSPEWNEFLLTAAKVGLVLLVVLVVAAILARLVEAFKK